MSKKIDILLFCVLPGSWNFEASTLRHKRRIEKQKAEAEAKAKKAKMDHLDKEDRWEESTQFLEHRKGKGKGNRANASSQAQSAQQHTGQQQQAQAQPAQSAAQASAQNPQPGGYSHKASDGIQKLCIKWNLGGDNCKEASGHADKNNRGILYHRCNFVLPDRKVCEQNHSRVGNI